jgi:hypothetical protein
MQESVREWTPTPLGELPLWELESQSIFELLEGDCRGQIHCIEKFLISLNFFWILNV